ncbi:class I SAM-dependent methyltransferase [Chitinivibrio alkaliphilus]|uniref:S-adenosylmethionine-dependent methyltransferase n=1 Tax=Chitinivibrio alkaliphilus ACht1 TaxID=1313304 RepID=U7D2V8_9BACT|nr:class I SAM-dependent methyltransferase [Chitinivibrio alkaliphilus]ERP30824.1 S-adenosylmethionine-dependent methyltransferase [Chitinivibrio alkaliphilus ACht1]
MCPHIFNPKKRDALNNPERHKDFPVEEILRQRKISPPRIALDLGAGTGFFSKALAPLMAAPGLLYAADISPEMIQYMKAECCPHLPQLHPLLLTDHRIPCKDAEIDLIIMVNVFHELPHPQESLRECKRVLHPTGDILISDWRPDAGPGGPPREDRISHTEVEAICEEAGLSPRFHSNDFPHAYLVHCSH